MYSGTTVVALLACTIAAAAAAAVETPREPWEYTFFCTTISVNNDTAIEEQCPEQNVCGAGIFHQDTRVLASGEGRVYLKSTNPFNGHCHNYLQNAACSQTGSRQVSCVARECQMSTWSDWYPCEKHCGTEMQPRNQTFVFEILVQATQTTLYYGKPCIRAEQHVSCNLPECEGDPLDPRVKTFLIIAGCSFGCLLLSPICILGVRHCSGDTRKIKVEPTPQLQAIPSQDGHAGTVPTNPYRSSLPHPHHRNARQARYAPQAEALPENEIAQPPSPRVQVVEMTTAPLPERERRNSYESTVIGGQLSQR